MIDELSAHGAGFRAYVHEFNLRFDISNIYDHREDLFAELGVLHKNGTGEYNVAQWDSFNLKSRSRDNFAAKLAKNWHEPIPPFDTILQELTFRLCQELRKGDEAVELMSGTEVPPLKWLLNPIIPDELATIIYGPKSSGKTALALLMYFVANLPMRENPFGWTPMVDEQEPRPGLWLDFETSKAIVQRRINRLQIGLGLDCSLPIIYRRCSMPIASDVESLCNLIADKNVGWVFIDSLGPAVGGDINSPEPAIKFFEKLRQLHVTPIALAHTAKNSTGEKSVFGSGFFEFLARSLWEVKGELEETTGDLLCAMVDRKSSETRKRKPMGYRIHFEDPDGGIFITHTEEVLHTSETLSQTLSLSDRIVYVLLHNGKMSVDAVCQELPCPDGKDRDKWDASIRVMLYKLAEKKRVVNFGKGTFGAVVAAGFEDAE